MYHLGDTEIYFKDLDEDVFNVGKNEMKIIWQKECSDKYRKTDEWIYSFLLLIVTTLLNFRFLQPLKDFAAFTNYQFVKLKSNCLQFRAPICCISLKVLLMSKCCDPANTWSSYLPIGRLLEHYQNSSNW